MEYSSAEQYHLVVSSISCSVLRSPSDSSDRICVELEISKNQYGISTSITFSLTVKNSTVGSSHVLIVNDYLTWKTFAHRSS